MDYYVDGIMKDEKGKLIGNNKNDGTIDFPLATIGDAIKRVNKDRKKSIMSRVILWCND